MSNTDAQTFTKTLREAAMNEAQADLQYSLRGAADLLDNAIDDFAEQRNAAALIDVNGIWAHANKLLQLHRTPKQPQPPRSASAELPQRKAA